MFQGSLEPFLLSSGKSAINPESNINNDQIRGQYGEKTGNDRKVTIISKRVISIDANELFQSPEVIKFMEDMAHMAQLEKF